MYIYIYVIHRNLEISFMRTYISTYVHTYIDTWIDTWTHRYMDT